VHFEQWERDDIEVRLILKGGGCENTNAQYALPTELDHLGRADRTLDGVRKCILHAVWKAQGKDADRALSASALAATARQATSTRKSSCSARSTMRTRTSGWPRSRKRSSTKPTG
jgi:tartrate dehydratase alpha subunit/fumarate hydratase class I-like protein